MFKKSNQNGLIQIPITFLFLSLIATTVFLVSQRTNFLPKAFEAAHFHESRVTVIDIGPESAIAEIIQKEFPSNDELAQRLLQKNYIPKQQLIDEFGEEFERDLVTVVQKYPAALLYLFLDKYLHGAKVVDVLLDVWSDWGFYTAGVKLIPLQTVFDKEDLKFTQDNLKNPGISLNFNPIRIITLLGGDTNKVINMSFQVGDVAIFLEKFKEIPDVEMPEVYYELDKNGNPVNTERLYLAPFKGAPVGYYLGEISIPMIRVNGEDQLLVPITEEEYQALKAKKEAEQSTQTVESDNPSIKIVGSYTKEKAAQNLAKLFEICQAYPDKLFIVAAGNEQEDLREALEQLQYEKPINLLIVAEWETDFISEPKNKVYGADIYVDNTSIGLPPGSSFSTPVISARASVLFAQERSLEEVKAHILDESATAEYKIDGIIESTKIFNPKEIK